MSLTVPISSRCYWHALLILKRAAQANPGSYRYVGATFFCYKSSTQELSRKKSWHHIEKFKIVPGTRFRGPFLYLRPLNRAEPLWNMRHFRKIQYFSQSKQIVLNWSCLLISSRTFCNSWRSALRVKFSQPLHTFSEQKKEEDGSVLGKPVVSKTTGFH